jgi:hypothetical protein
MSFLTDYRLDRQQILRLALRLAAIVLTAVAASQISSGSQLPWLVLLLLGSALLFLYFSLDKLLTMLIVGSLASQVDIFPRYFRVPVPGIDVWFASAEVLFLAVLVGWLASGWRRRKLLVHFSGINLAAVMFLGSVAFVSVVGLVNGNPVQDVILESRKLILYALIPIVSSIVPQEQSSQRVCIAILAGAAIAAIAQLGTLIVVPEKVFEAQHFETNYRMRMGLVRMDVLIAAGALHFGFFARVRTLVRRLARLVLFAQILLSVLTISRSLWLSLVLVVALVVFINRVRRRRGAKWVTGANVAKWVAFMLLAGIAIAASLPILLGDYAPVFVQTVDRRVLDVLNEEEVSSVNQRWEATRLGFEMASSKPILGHGLGTDVSPVVGAWHSVEGRSVDLDSPLAWMVIKGGFLWPVFWLALLASAPLQALRLLKQADQRELEEYDRAVLVWTVSAGIAVLFQTILPMSHFVIENPFYIVLLCVLWGQVERIRLSYVGGVTLEQRQIPSPAAGTGKPTLLGS